MISEMESVNIGIEMERLYAREQRVEKIVTKSSRVTFIKLETVDQVFLGRIKDLDAYFV